MNSKASLAPMVLSGGAGTRLWPLSRRRVPKQLRALVGTQTMLQSTLTRIADLGEICAQPLVVASELHADAIQEQLASIDVAAELILEPIGRNTAPAIALAAESACRAGKGETILLVMPADHVIQNESEFCQRVLVGVEEAAQGAMVTFGVVPKFAHTGYGYIEAAASDEPVSDVVRFVEKPDAHTAEQYLASGKFLWNSGIFMFRADAFMAELEAHAGDIASTVRQSLAAGTVHANITRPDAELFAATRSESIDYAVMERTDNCRVIPIDVGWSDVGSWPSLHDSLPHDPNGNTLSGDVIAIDVKDSLIRADSRLVAVCGLSNVIVVESDDIVMIADKSQSERVKEFVTQLSTDDRKDLI